MKEIIIDNTNEGGRLDKLLSIYLDKAPRGFVYKMLRKKNIVLNDRKASGNEILKKGDNIKIYLADETFSRFHSERKVSASPLSGNDLKGMIVYEDEHLLVMNKPAGMLTQKARAYDISLNDLMLAYLSNEYKTDDINFKAGISNRLDRNTSGLVIAGKDLTTTRALNEAIKAHEIEKIYYCIIYGVIDRELLITGYISKDEKTNRVKISDEMFDGAKEIKTKVKPIADNGELSFAEVELITGKTHQIRAQLSHIGHFIIGDMKYGDRTINNRLRDKYGSFDQMLHAGKIKFNTKDGELSYLNEKTIEAPLPDDLAGILEGEKIWLHGAAAD